MNNEIIEITNESGTIAYTQTTLATIVGTSTVNVPGVVGMSSTKNGLFELLKKEEYFKGVNISFENNKLVIKIHVIAVYGTKLSEVANNILKDVKYSVENITGLKVGSISVFIDNVKVDIIDKK